MDDTASEIRKRANMLENAFWEERDCMEKARMLKEIIRCMGPIAACSFLEEVLREEKDYNLKGAAAKALGKVAGKKRLFELAEEGVHPNVRKTAEAAIRRRGFERKLPVPSKKPGLKHALKR